MRLRIWWRNSMRFAAVCAVAAFGVGILGSGIGLAAEADVRKCIGFTAPQERVTACTVALSQSSAAPRDAAAFYYYRGFSQTDLRKEDDAIADFDAAVRLDPDLWPAYWVRAEIKGGRRRYSDSVADWTRVIEIKPGLPAPYANRGGNYDNMGNPQQALVDINKAIDLATAKAQLAELYVARANVEEAGRQWDKAQADYEAAIQRDGRHSRAYNGRGRVRYLNGNPAAAIADFAKAGEFQPSETYYLLWQYLAEARASKERDALADLRRRASAVDLKAWPGPIIQVVLGDLAPEQVAPPSWPTGWTAEERRLAALCELNFFRGEQAAIRGNRALAAQLYKAAVDTNITEYIEHRSASAQLVRLGR